MTVFRIDFAIAFFEVLLVEEGDGFDLGLESGDEGFGEDGDAVVFAFAVADGDLEAIEIYVFDAQAHTFHTCTCAALRRKCRCDAQAAAVHDLADEFVDACEVFEDAFDFFFGEDGGDGFGALGAKFGEAGFVQVDVEDVAVEEKDGASTIDAHASQTINDLVAQLWA